LAEKIIMVEPIMLRNILADLDDIETATGVDAFIVDRALLIRSKIEDIMKRRT